jgi:Mor family transcriptional regulator
MQMHILSDSQHKELTETLSKLQSILGGSVSVSLDSKPASAPVAKATVAAKPKATSRTRRGRRNILNETKVVTIKSRLEAGESAAKIARDYRVAANVIYSIKYGLTWKHVSIQQDATPASVNV